jgi:hypothetical protein
MLAGVIAMDAPVMPDELFLDKINEILRAGGFDLPLLPLDEPPPPDALSPWAAFLERCAARGLRLSDPRWRRLRLDRRDGRLHFVLEGLADPPPDEDFRIGLQLLLGMIGSHRDAGAEDGSGS